MSENIKGRAVYIVDGSRTPFLKARGVGEFSASSLAFFAGSNLLNKLSFEAENIDEVILGLALPGVDEANIARIVALRLGCGDKVPAYTVMRNCASGMQAIDNAFLQISSGRSEIILAGGTDAMSHAPLLFQQNMARWLSKWYASKSFGARAKTALEFKPSYFVPVIALLRGLRDPIAGMNMGQTAEKLAYKFGITRLEMDEFAARSHQLALDAYANGFLNEITPIISTRGNLYARDDGVRDDSSIAKLAKLKPYFDKKYGMVTPGNSSQVTDGSCMLLLASAKAVKKYNLPVLGKITDTQWAALDPTQMGLGPVHAATPILQRHKLKVNDLDAWEINEAFAAQVLSCVAAWNSPEYCQKHFQTSVGPFDLEKLNQNGGAIAIGHPIGASGARIVLQLLNNLRQKDKAKGMATICIGGGQGGAMLVENLTGVRDE